MTTMETFQNPDVYDAVQKAHRPMVPGTDALNPTIIPLSARANNKLVALTDGLYLGDSLPNAVYYVNSAGVDTAAGTKAAPWKTLDGALTNILALAGGSYRANVTLALQAGQTFPLTHDLTVLGGSITLTFYGDPAYGDFNSATIPTSGADPAVMSDLQRPVITPASSQVNAQWKIAGFNLMAGAVTLTGVTVTLPNAPASPAQNLYSNACDFVRCLNGGTGVVTLYGSIVNAADVTAFFGFLGLLARALNPTLVQFASQFRVAGLILQDSTATQPQLIARANLIKFYADFAGNNQQLGTLTPVATNSSSGSAILNLIWSDTESLTVNTGKTNQATFPLLSNQNFGLRNYFTGLTRDQQQRPMNAVTPRLF